MNTPETSRRSRKIRSPRYVVLKDNDPRLRGETATLFVIASVLLEMRVLFGSEIDDHGRAGWGEIVAGGDLRCRQSWNENECARVWSVIARDLSVQIMEGEV